MTKFRAVFHGVVERRLVFFMAGATLLLALRDIVFRTDFLPFAGMVTAVVGRPEIFALPFAFGTLASAVDSLMTLAKVRAR